jgi:hypothetical protein
VGLFYCFILSDGILLVEKLAAPPPPHWPQMYLMEKLRSQKSCEQILLYCT